MKAILDLTSKKSKVVISDISHDDALSTIDKMIEFDEKLADKANELKYRYIPGPLSISGKEEWLRLFCSLNGIEMEVKYSFPPMPIN